MTGKQSKDLYFQRRIVFFSIIAVVLIITAVLLLLPKGQTPAQDNEIAPGEDEGQQPQLPDVGSILSNLPAPLAPPTNDVVQPGENQSPEPPASAQPGEENLPESIPSPIPQLGSLKRIEQSFNNVFELYGAKASIAQAGVTLEDMITKVERECTQNEVLNIECAVDTVLYSSEKSWVCEWACLVTLDSCYIYKFHLLVAVLRHWLPATDVFVGRTKNFHFFALYKNYNGQWMSPGAISSNDDVVALYNEIYYAGQIPEVFYPDLKYVKPGEQFCFETESQESCVCNVQVGTFKVGDCPQLPADLKEVCYKPITKMPIAVGRNKICFQVQENATPNFYTYDFILTGGSGYIPAGDAFIKADDTTCCLEGTSFKGFLIIEEEDEEED